MLIKNRYAGPADATINRAPRRKPMAEIRQPLAVPR